MIPHLTEADFSPAFCTQLVADHGAITFAAKALEGQVRSERLPGLVLSSRRIAEYIRNGIRSLNGGTGIDMSRPSDPERLNRIDALIDRANIPLEALGAIKSTRLKAYAGFYKSIDKNGNPTSVRVPMYSTSIDITPPDPRYPVAQQAPPTTILFAEPPRILRKTRQELVVSDIQAGWLRDSGTDVLEPIHDPDAIDVAQQVTRDVAPSKVIFVGDVADLAMFSRWSQHPEYDRTLQPSIDVVHQILGEFISAAGPQCTERIMIGSNHDHRIEKGVLEWNKQALGVRRAGQPDGWPVFSLGYLARFDDLGLQWSGHFPGGEYYMLDDLVVMHAPPKAKEFRASVIHGHTHHITTTPAVQHSRAGRISAFVYDIGCLCQTGATTEQFRLLVTKVPSDRGRTDWNQGIAVVSIVDGLGSQAAFHSVEQVSIVDGRANFAGAHYTARALEEAA